MKCDGRIDYSLIKCDFKIRIMERLAIPALDEEDEIVPRRLIAPMNI